jgi:hypothetical protein
MRIAVIKWVVLCGLFAGCASDQEKYGTESHFLRECQSSLECGADLSCLEGHCTSRCDADAVCKALDPDAICVSGLCSDTAEPESTDTASSDDSTGAETSTSVSDATNEPSVSDETDVTDATSIDTASETQATTVPDDTETDSSDPQSDADVPQDEMSSELADGSARDTSTGSDDASDDVDGGALEPTSSDTSGTTEGPGASLECSTPVPLTVEGQDTGFTRCGEERVVYADEPRFRSSVLHRTAVTQCPNLLGTAAREACSGSALSDPSEPCTDDSDCGTLPNGFCSLVPTAHYPACGCSYGCVSDADCAEGEICECGDPVGQCRPALCSLDADCAPDALCASAPLTAENCTFNPPVLGYSCQSANDECLSDQDCTTAGATLCVTSEATGARVCARAPAPCP